MNGGVVNKANICKNPEGTLRLWGYGERDWSVGRNQISHRILDVRRSIDTEQLSSNRSSGREPFLTYSRGQENDSALVRSAKYVKKRYSLAS